MRLSVGESAREEADRSNGQPVAGASAMSGDLIPDDVLQFITTHIDSIAELEALLLMRKSADQEWGVTQMAARLYIADSDCAKIMSRLEAAGHCMLGQGGFRYAPLSGASGETVDRLAYAYSHHLIPVTNLIHQKPDRVKQFSDAFKFRKGK